MEYVKGFTGRIMWLPEKSNVIEDLRPQINDAAYNHPVMRLSPRLDTHGQVKVLMVTSFGGEVFMKVHKTPERRAGYLPIAPSDEHPDTGELLKLDSECPDMRKKSYVNTKQIHGMDFSILKDHLEYGRARFLDKISYLKVADACGYRAPPEATLGDFIKDDDLMNSGKGKKSLKRVDASRKTGGQKEPVQDAHPDPPLDDAVADGQGQSDNGGETNDEALGSVLEEVGVENLVSLRIEESTGRTKDGVDAALPAVDKTVVNRNDAPTALTLHGSDDGIVGTDHRILEPSSSAVAPSPALSSSILSSEGGSASEAEEDTPSDFPTAADIQDSSSVEKVTTTTALASTDKNTTSEKTSSSDEESLSSSSSETDSTTFSIVSSTSSWPSSDAQLLHSAELSGDNRTLLGVVSCAALLACVCVLAWVYWGFPGA